MHIKVNKSRRLCAFLTALMLVGSTITMTVPVVSADAVPVVTLGENLSSEQKEKILQFFGTSEDSVEVLTVNNLDERKYLEGLVSDDIIGTRTLSCSYILPTTTGGIVVKTANLNWVTDGMLANALLTSGVENCQVIATAPFEVSGTGALTGVMLAYETSMGTELDESKKELASEELVLTGELIDAAVLEDSKLEEIAGEDGTLDEVQFSRYVVEMLNDLKGEALNGNLTEEKAKEIVEKRLTEYGLAFSEELVNKLVSYLMSFSSEKYSDTFFKSLSSLTERISTGFDININLNLFSSEGVAADESLSDFRQLWDNFIIWLKYVFGTAKESIGTVGEKAQSIFDKVNTNVIKYDEPVEITEEDLQNVDIVPDSLLPETGIYTNDSSESETENTDEVVNSDAESEESSVDLDVLE